MIGRALTLALAVAACSCSSKPEVRTNPNGSDAPSAPRPPTFTLFALAEMRGQIGPCGCTSDPLGDISRTAKLVDDARRAGPVVVVDAGSMLYSQDPIPPQLHDQEELKANLLRQVYANQLRVAAIGLGPADLADGPAAIGAPRQAVNVSDPKLAIDAPKIVEAGGAKIGIFGVVARDALPASSKLTVADPVPAATAAIADLRGKGAQVVVALVQAPSKRDAAELVRAIDGAGGPNGAIDFAIGGLGLNAPEPQDVSIEAEKLGASWLVIPGNRGQVLSRLDITLDGGAPFVDAIGRGAADARAAALDARLVTADAELAKFAADPSADKGFVAAKRAEREQIVAQRDALRKQPIVAPARGSFFTLDQIRINKLLACSAPVQDEVTDYDRKSGEANVVAAAGKPPIPARDNAATYVGMAKCTDCHDDEYQFWKKTVHFTAWQTLVDRGQQFDYSCIGCHVTGFDKPGGSNLAHNDNLRDVQCEVCHGPGSIHVAKGGTEKPLALVTAPAPELCATQCHTKEHSDTFQYEAYLRDITGKGHGEKRRAQLGDGPTGHSLRTAALDKAGHTLGAGCTR